MKRISDQLLRSCHAFVHALGSEFRYFYSDKTVLVTFVGVAALIFILYAYCYSPQTLTKIVVVVIDLDNTDTSRKFLRMAQACGDIYVAGHKTDMPGAKAAVLSGRARGILVIPAHFSADLKKNRQVYVSVYADGAYLLYYKQILTILRETAAYFSAGLQIRKKMLQGNTPEQASSAVQPVSGRTVDLYNLRSGYGTFLMPAILVIIFQTTMLNAIGLLGGTMSEKHEFHRAYPGAGHFFGTFPVVLGKALVYLLTGLPLLIFFVGVIMPYYNIPVRSDMLSVVVFMIPYLLSLGCLGLFLLIFFKRRETAVTLIMFTSIPALMLTGVSWPDQELPGLFKALGVLVPSTPGTRGFVSLTQMGADFSVVKDYWLQLWGLCLFYFSLAVLSIKHLCRP